MVRLSTSGKNKLDRILIKAVEEKKIHGLSFAASDLDGEIYFGAAGLKNMENPVDGEVDEESVFWICSHTKLVVSIAILQLVEQGKIAFDTPVATIIPELANPIILDDITAVENPSYKPAKTQIILAHLLNHSSGLYYEPVAQRAVPFGLPFSYTHPFKKGDSISMFYDMIKRGLPGVPLKFEPGTNYAYGYNTDTIGFIVERITGQNLEEYCKEHIFAPLGMKTTFHRTPEMKKNSVNLSFREPDGTLSPWRNQAALSPQDAGEVYILLGGIGLNSTLKDYLTLLRHLLQVHAGLATNPILSAETVQKIFQPTLTKEGAISLKKDAEPYKMDSQWSIAICLTTSDRPGKRKKGSGYWYGYAGTYYFMDPTSGIAAVYGSQVLPTKDPDTQRVWGELEEALYSGLEAETFLPLN